MPYLFEYGAYEDFSWGERSLICTCAVHSMGSIHSRGLLFQCQQKVYPAVLLLYFFLDCWEHGAAYIGWLKGGWPRQSAMAHSHATDLVLGCLWLWHRDDRDVL
ncbi:hypothetical protein R6Q59_012743 [Mikania micrantha]